MSAPQEFLASDCLNETLAARAAFEPSAAVAWDRLFHLSLSPPMAGLKHFSDASPRPAHFFFQQLSTRR